MYNYLLNTENYEPVFRASKKTSDLVRENDAIIARLNKLVDLNIILPQPLEADVALNEDILPPSSPGNRKSAGDMSSADPFLDQRSTNKIEHKKEVKKEKYSPPQKSETNLPGVADDPGDYLRNYLDEVLNITEIPCTQFHNVQSPRVRQLLMDNYRLSKVREQKQEANSRLLEISKRYHHLLKDFAIPRLTKDVYMHRIRQCQADYKAIASSSQDEQLWKTYMKYLLVLEKIRGVAEKLVGLVAMDANDATISRLHMQLDIIMRLKSQLERQSLTYSSQLTDKV